jgi:beta-lactamase regulating signal transducer with metallopeptidase domain
MSDYLSMLSGPQGICLGLALVHFLWQGLGIGIVLEIALVLAGPKNAALRHVFCGVALAIMPLCLVGTYSMLDSPGAQPLPLPLAAHGPIDATLAEGTPPAEAFPSVSAASISSAIGLAPSPGFNRWMPAIVAGWLVGVIILAARKVGGFIVLWRLRRRGVSAPTDAMLELFQKACARVGIDPQRACLKISRLVQVPMTMGWIQPIVLFPAVLLTGLSTGEIELLLAHELAHIRRYDYLVNLVQSVVETLFFYHPATWWISRRMRQERENACDDLVAAPAEKLAYAKVLLRLETLRAPGGLLAPAANGGNLLQRVQRLASESSPAPAMGLPGLVAVAGILVLIGVLPLLQAQTNSAPMSQAEAESKGVAALVNGTPILWADIKRFDLSPETWLKAKYNGDELKKMVAENWRGQREWFIQTELIVQKFEASGEKLSADFVNEPADRLAYAVKGFDGDKNAFAQNLQKNGISLEQWNENNRRNTIVNYMTRVNVDDAAQMHLFGKVRYDLKGKLTPDEGKQLQVEYEKVEREWHDSLRAGAVIQRFDMLETGSSSPPTLLRPRTATQPRSPVLVASVDRPSGIAVPTVDPSYADSPFQQRYISDQMDRLTKRLSLTSDQESTLRATMEAVVHQDATKTVDQTLREILSPEQEAIWEQVKTEARDGEVRMYAMNEMNRIATLFPLSAAQKIQVQDALTQLRFNDRQRDFHSLAELTAHNNSQVQIEELALAKILSPGQMVIYDQQKKAELLETTGELPYPASLTDRSTWWPPRYKKPIPPMAPLPELSLQYNMPGQ